VTMLIHFSENEYFLPTLPEIPLFNWSSSLFSQVHFPIYSYISAPNQFHLKFTEHISIHYSNLSDFCILNQ
jgi:hypothetical protein